MFSVLRCLLSTVRSNYRAYAVVTDSGQYALFLSLCRHVFTKQVHVVLELLTNRHVEHTWKRRCPALT